MLKVFSVLCNECRTKFLKLLAELRSEFRAYQIFDRLLGAGIGMNADIKLKQISMSTGFSSNFRKAYREHTTYSSSSVSCAASGIVMVPLTPSAPLIFPKKSKYL